MTMQRTDTLLTFFKRLAAPALCAVALVMMTALFYVARAEDAADPAIAKNKLPTLEDSLDYIAEEWARIKYKVSDRDTQLKALQELEIYTESLTEAHPDKAEAMAWEGVVLATDAGIVNGLSALSKATRARELLEKSIVMDKKVMDGFPQSVLGALYYRVPGWPIGFGDSDKAEENFKAAMEVDPRGIDVNYYYGEYLIYDGRYNEAVVTLKRALQAPSRPGRTLADEGRRRDAGAALNEALEKAKAKSAKGPYNN